MLLWLSLIILLVGLVLLIIDFYFDSYRWGEDITKNKVLDFIYDHSEGVAITAGIVISVSITVVLILLAIMGINYVSANSKVAQLHERYNAIVYKIESDSCRDEFGLLNKEIIDEVQDWNENITYCQNMKHNFWIGIVYPDIYDQFQTIDYTEFEKK